MKKNEDFGSDDMLSNNFAHGNECKRIVIRLLFLFCLISPWVMAQPIIPVVAGAHLEVGTGQHGAENQAGLVRAMPWVAWWSAGLGWVRVGYGVTESKVTDSLAVTLREHTRHLSLQGGISLGGPERPYILVSMVRSRILADYGDIHWNEWGIGLGSMLPFNPWCGVLLEAEHRWVLEHENGITHSKHQGTRLQLNLGFLIFLY